MIKTDHHMHTNASVDSPGEMEDMIKQAVDLGLTEICITNHADFHSFTDIQKWDLTNTYNGFIPLSDYVKVLPDGETCEVAIKDFTGYIDTYQRLSQTYAEKISVLMGCELGLYSYSPKAVTAYANKHPFDFIIASQHTLGRRDIGLNRASFFVGRSKHEAYTTHLTEMIQNVRDYDCFDVLGHIDYIVRYWPDEDRDIHIHEFDDLLTALFKTLAEKGKGIEINTSGFRYGLNRTHPGIDLLRKYRECGGEIITVGSDAHRPEHVGGYLTEATQILQEAGFKAYTKFNQRKPIFIDL